MKKGDIAEGVSLTSISSDGKAVGRIDGQVIFVKNAVPGDIANVKVLGKDKKFLIGQAEELVESSPDRIDPTCQHFGICGGCKWQNLNYEAQLRHKQQHVADNMRKIAGGMDLPELSPIIGAPDPFFYRNKLEFTFSNKRWLTREEIQSDEKFEMNALGFHIPRMFDKILDIEKCHLQNDLSNQVRNELRDFALRKQLTFYDLRKHQGLLRNIVIRTSTLEETMVIMQFGEKDSHRIDQVMNFLEKSFPQITSLNYIVNTKKNDSYQDQEVIHFSGQLFIREKLGSLTYRIGPKSFFQTNSKQAERLYEKVRELANIQANETVYDLYTGTGTIANYLADQASKVVGIEYVEEAILDARLNASDNQIKNTHFFAGDMKDILDETFIQEHGQPNVIVTDPPRAGMHPDVVGTILKAGPDRIVYVSCNPATQARDLEMMKDDYRVEVLQPVDMFPQTHHVENIALLVRKDA